MLQRVNLPSTQIQDEGGGGREGVEQGGGGLERGEVVPSIFFQIG